MLTIKIKNTGAACSLGVLIMRGVDVVTDAAAFFRKKTQTEELLRIRYGGYGRDELKALHPMDVYIAYYKRFGSTYHVLPQLESIIKGREIPSVLPPVTAMFMGELKNMQLTAGHDLDVLQGALTLRRSSGGEEYTVLGGKVLKPVESDFLLADEKGIVSSILRGPDDRTAISAQTRNVLYTVYAPKGVDEGEVISHLRDIEASVRLYAGGAQTAEMRFFQE